MPTTTPDHEHRNRIYHCGTLSYTKIGLVSLFAWLLWGDFCFTLMESVVPSVLPLKLKDLGCSNWMMGMILSTIPGVLNMTICPYVSFKSDRYRSRWGRRIPFIIATMPFLCISLALLGWSEDIGALLQKNSVFLRAFTPATLTIGLIAIFMAMFQFFNMFVNSVFWYLFNDVVPPRFFGRFVGMFRIVGSTASALYNYFIYRFAESNMREIMLWGAVIYLIGFGLVCFMIKEGEYPPVEEYNEDGKKSKMHELKIFFTESFSHKFYWLIFLFTAVQCSAGSIRIFEVFYNQQMGLTLDQIGKLGALCGIASLVAMYFSAIFIDRWHPVRVNAYLAVFGIVGNMIGWVWLFVRLPGSYFFWLSLGSGIVGVFQSALVGGAMLPLYMRCFPQSRYGQICSAQALFRSFCALVCGILAGAFIDLMKWLYHGSDFAYRYYFIWPLVFSILLAIVAVYMYRKWYELGGDAHYQPPASWSQSGIEEMMIVPIVGTRRFWLNIVLHIYNGIMLLSIVGIIPLMWWMDMEHMTTAFYWHGAILLPASIGGWFLWKVIEIRIRRDMKRCLAGEPLHNGLPHHGIPMVIAIQFLVTVPIWISQVGAAITHHMEMGAIVFTASNIATNLALSGCVWFMARFERGRLTTLDTMLAEEKQSVYD